FLLLSAYQRFSVAKWSCNNCPKVQLKYISELPENMRALFHATELSFTGEIYSHEILGIAETIASTQCPP
ncbi:hypothetical protein AVEN_235194-1, partial [Araneus ventricosus]